jgi:hypothetical protein
MIRQSVEYKLITRHYGDRRARRSQVPLINHIDEGLVVLENISATDAAKRAFCLHPLLQNDEDLKENAYMVSFVEPHVILLAMEYRSVANEFLSDKIPAHRWDNIRLSPLWEVNDMLVADKVQNYKDFITYHKGTHPRSDELDIYFLKWLEVLKISDSFDNLCDVIDASKK